jgi:hypothetical protein
MYTIIGTSTFTDFHMHGLFIINKSVVFLNMKVLILHITHQAFHSIINEKKDVFVNLTTGAGNHIFITPLPKLFDVIFGFKYLNKL